MKPLALGILLALYSYRFGFHTVVVTIGIAIIEIDDGIGPVVYEYHTCYQVPCHLGKVVANGGLAQVNIMMASPFCNFWAWALVMVMVSPSGFSITSMSSSVGVNTFCEIKNIVVLCWLH